MIDEAPQLGTINLAFAEELYASYLRDPSSVSADWREYFELMRNLAAGFKSCLGTAT